MKRFFFGSLLATVAMFVFGAVFWMNPMPYRLLPRVKDDAAAGKALLAAFPDSGTFLVPSPTGDPKQMAELSRQGPVATVHIVREGVEPMAPRGFIDGFLQEWVSVLLMALVLKIALPALGGYAKRVLFVTLIGITAAFFSDFSMPIWWHHPWPFYKVLFVYDVGAWFVTALVLAGFVRPVATVAASPAA